MINAQTISDALGGKRAGRWFLACCPAHDDQKPSLLIRDGDNDMPVVNCRTGCQPETVINALQSKGLWPKYDARNLSQQGLQAMKEETAKRKREREAKELAEQAKAVKEVAAILANISFAPNDNTTDPAKHPYANKKRVPLSKLIKRGPWPQRNWKDALLIPLYDKEGRITSISAINANLEDKKDLLKGGKMTGCFHPLGKIRGATGKILIGEGIATISAAVQATGYPGVMAVCASNLLHVVKVVKQLAPKAEIIIIADDDRKADGSNPGKAAGIAAALAVNGKVAIPDLGRKADLWDLWNEQGPDAVKKLIESAVVIGQPSTRETKQDKYCTRVKLLRGSDVTPEAVNWLWDGWLAAGKMHVLGGAPGTGKTTIAMSLAATVTTGGRWPDGSSSPVGNVVIWSGEDDPVDTLVPRLIASGAALNRVFFITDVIEGTVRRSFDPARDMESLRHKLADIGGVSLLIVDPIVSAVQGDSHKNAEVRRSLQPLADLAATMRCALLGITHFSKGTGGRDPVERLTGSLAFGALARVVLVAAKNQDEEGGRTVRLFLRAKSNIGPDNGGFEYDFSQDELKAHPGIFASSVLWGDIVEGAARELLATAETVSEDGNGESVGTVTEWLRQLLTEEGGRADRRDVMKAAQAMGHKDRTVHRAREKLGVIIEQSGFGKNKRSLWTLPNSFNHAPIMPCVPDNLLGMIGTIDPIDGTHESETTRSTIGDEQELEVFEV